MATKIQNKYDRETSSYVQGQYEVRNTDKAIFGRLALSKADKSNKWHNLSLSFVAFKNDIDEQTISILLNYSGENLKILGEPEIAVNDKDGKVYNQLKIKEVRVYEKQASRHSQDKGNGYVPQSSAEEEVLDDICPF